MSTTDRSRIRCIAICIVEYQDQWLVLEGKDPVSKTYFYRPLGGGIELGETGEQTVQREFLEETGHRLGPPVYRETLENIFIYKGRTCHELVRVYQADLADNFLYTQSRIIAHEDDGSPFTVLWVPLKDFMQEEKRLVPEGILNLVRR
jgi:8-oxo-dGTP pyrophosphatase MutT (NUDIX family)